MSVAHDYSSMIRELHGELHSDLHDQGERWRLRAYEIAKGRWQSPRAFIEWASRDRHWSFTLAEVMAEACAKPSELAARLLIAILEELREEQQTAMALSE
jgi:hypothetical protein